MKIIQKPDSVFENLVGFDDSESEERYRLSNFVVRQEVTEGLLMYHTLTCEMVLVDKEPVCQPDSDSDDWNYLRAHLFYVPESMDEKEVVRQYRMLRKMMDSKKQTGIVHSYTILTTTDCNARCFYCYEQGRSRIPMSAKTAMKVVAMIERNYAKLKEYQSEKGSADSKSEVKLSWFGGEPLYNVKVIDLICSELEKRGVPFKSSMISNGYLFDEEMVRRAVESWKLKRVQITLDGTEAVYNRSKAFIYEDASPYKRVVRNIGLLLDAGIRVSVRLNIGLHNADDLFALVRSLADIYGGKKGLSCYVHPLFEESAGCNNVKLTEENHRLVYGKQEELETLINDLGFSSQGSSLSKEIKRNHCMADSSNSVVVVPTGEIGLCEHYSESNFISNVDSLDVVDKEMVAKHREVREEIELCDKCPIYPQCIRLKMCEEAALCIPEIVNGKVNLIKRTMMKIYEKKS